MQNAEIFLHEEYMFMEKLMEILKDLRPDIDFETADKLIDNEMLDSFDIISLVGELNGAFGVEIRVENLLPENFNSPKAMMELITRLEDEG